MPRNLASGMLTLLAGDATDLVACWKVVRSTGASFGVTSADHDITIASGTYAGTYSAAISGAYSQATSSVDGSPANLEIAVNIPDGSTLLEDIVKGLYRGAIVTMFLCSASDPNTPGQIPIMHGRFGQTTLTPFSAHADVMSFLALPSQKVGSLVSAACRAQEVGDAFCQVDLNQVSDTGHSFRTSVAVSAVADARRTFTFSGDGDTYPDGWFRYGKGTWTSGNNAGVVSEIKDSIGNQILLCEPVYRDIAIGNGITLIAGCPKTRSACKTKFRWIHGGGMHGNLLNFRAEAYVPGLDVAINTL